MNVRILKKDDINIKLVIEDVPVEFANSLRRIILTEIPTFAIDTVDILENNSPTFDEIVAQTLGIIGIILIADKLFLFPVKCVRQVLCVKFLDLRKCLFLNFRCWRCDSIACWHCKAGIVTALINRGFPWAVPAYTDCVCIRSLRC